MSETAPQHDHQAALVRINAEYEAQSRLESEIRPGNHAALFDALAAVAITHVIVVFDGEGDSGQIESIDARAGETATTLPATHIQIIEALPDGAGVRSVQISVHDALEAFAYRLLDETHSGWENNDGAYGEFVFDVAARAITLDHNERFTDVESFSHAWGG